MGIAEETGNVPDALQKRPDIPEHWVWVWDAFFELSNDRSFAFSIGPIPSSAIHIYAHAHGITDQDQLQTMIEIIRAMDAVYLDHVRKPKP